MIKKALSAQDLPNDVLVYIFEHLARADPPRHSKDRWPDANVTISGALYDLSRRIPPEVIYTPHYHLGWIIATHVCRRWRNIFLSLSNLWANIVFRLPQAFDTILYRSRDAPLDMTVRMLGLWGEKSLASLVDFALDHIGRARSLRCLFSREQGARVPDVISSTTLPDLLYLTIINSSYSPYYRSDDIITSSILNLHASNLVAVTLSGIRCSFNSPSLRSFQYLGCGRIQDVDGYIFHVLKSNPMLEVLRYTMDCQPSNHAVDPPPSDGVIELSRLRKLCVSNDARYGDAAYFFRRVSFPPTCTFHYSETARPADLEGWHSPLDLCGYRLGQQPYDAVSIHGSTAEPSSVYHINTFFLDQCTESFGHFVASYTGYACCTNSTPAEESGIFLAPGVRLEMIEPHVPESDVPGGPGRWSFGDVLSSMVSHLRHEMITHLSLANIEHYFPAYGQDALVVALRPFTAVTTLSVLSENGRFRLPSTSAFQALVDGSAKEKRPVLPALRSLTVGFGTTLYERVKNSSWGSEESDRWWRALLSFLEMRQSDGVPVATLRLNGWWEEEAVRERVQDTDVVHLQRARELVDQVVDDRTVDDLITYV
ncbi:hypothetical protein PENSPDRAFT_751437 [Peniophora sp. CONT]|nr:hypothetical protein PENSPDRAFT_751437 [Peniophora sp. CONT]